MNVKQGDKITKRQADVLLREDLEMFSAQLHRVIKVPVTQNQYDALLSLCYNIGIGNFKKSTLLKLLNASDYNGAANEFSKWRKAKGKILNGLVTRRKLERKLFLKEEI
jgi:lysozyme